MIQDSGNWLYSRIVDKDMQEQEEYIIRALDMMSILLFKSSAFCDFSQDETMKLISLCSRSFWRMYNTLNEMTLGGEIKHLVALLLWSKESHCPMKEMVQWYYVKAKETQRQPTGTVWLRGRGYQPFMPSSMWPPLLFLLPVTTFTLTSPCSCVISFSILLYCLFHPTLNPIRHLCPKCVHFCP